VQNNQKQKVEAGVGREFKEKTRFELATASRESAKMKQSVQRVGMEEGLMCSTSREVLNPSEQAYNQRADAFYARTKANPAISLPITFFLYTYTRARVH
jgi:hypothetical protein